MPFLFIEMADTLTPTEESLKAKVVKYWLPVAAMLGLMYYFSTDALSGDATRGFIEQILDWLLSGVSYRTVVRVNYWVRKSAHFVEYAVLAALLYRAFRDGGWQKWRLRWAVYSFAAVAIWALLDEAHQSFTTRRGGSIYDALLDMAGGLFALIVIALLCRRKISS